ncbi:hypothetical protein SK128_004372, partial [Halocaridina rubra]
TAMQIFPYSASLTGNVATPMIFAVTSLVVADSLRDVTPSTTHHFTAIHASRGYSEIIQLEK